MRLAAGFQEDVDIEAICQMVRLNVKSGCCAVGVWLGSFLAPLVLTGMLTATLVSLVVFESSCLERVAP
jgi:hypothetical protein